MTEQFPLCKKAELELIDQLEISILDKHRGRIYISAFHVEALLASAPVTYGWSDGKDGWVFDTRVETNASTHMARLILIEPVEQKSREERLHDGLSELLGSITTSEYIKDGVCHFRAEFNRDQCELLEVVRRAKALLSEGKK